MPKNGIVSTTVNGKTLTEKDVLELSVKDGKPAAKLNGENIEVNAVQVTVNAVAECKCNGEVTEKAMKIPSKGGIGLQAEVGKFEFRHIRVKVLDGFAAKPTFRPILRLNWSHLRLNSIVPWGFAP